MADATTSTVKEINDALKAAHLNNTIEIVASDQCDIKLAYELVKSEHRVFVWCVKSDAPCVAGELCGIAYQHAHPNGLLKVRCVCLPKGLVDPK